MANVGSRLRLFRVVLAVGLAASLMCGAAKGEAQTNIAPDVAEPQTVPPAPVGDEPAVAPAAPPAFSEDEEKEDDGEDKEVDVSKLSDKAQKQLADDSFWKFFSAGVVVNAYLHEPPVTDAAIRGGKVRIKKQENVSAQLALQASYPIGEWTTVRSTDGRPLNDRRKEWFKYSEKGIGPYVSLSLASDSSIIDSVGVGLMYSYRRQAAGVKIGLGAAIKPQAKFLAPDFPKNKAPTFESTDTSTPTAVEYVEKAAVGYQLVITFTPGFGQEATVASAAKK